GARRVAAVGRGHRGFNRAPGGPVLGILRGGQPAAPACVEPGRDLLRRPGLPREPALVAGPWSDLDAVTVGGAGQAVAVRGGVRPALQRVDPDVLAGAGVQGGGGGENTSGPVERGHPIPGAV